MWFMMQAYEYNQRLEEQNQPRLTRNPINRDREDAERRLMVDYFDNYCKYPLYYFRRTYRISRKLFLDIVKDIESYTVDPFPKHFKFFTHRPDATGQMSMSVIMKCTSVIRQLAYGNTLDAFDEYFQMGEHTARNCLDNFNKCIIDLYMSKYLRKPTLADVKKIYNAHENIHGFSGMPGIIDSPFVINGVRFENEYYLGGIIYSQWETFVKSFTDANDEKHSFYKRRQESARKDVERDFVFLQGR
nr:reverse transcriptase domain-containing protein [Tanacetum cinerariifolium]